MYLFCASPGDYTKRGGMGDTLGVRLANAEGLRDSLLTVAEHVTETSAENGHSGQFINNSDGRSELTSHFMFSAPPAPPLSLIAFLLPEHLVEDPLCKHGDAVASPLTLVLHHTLEHASNAKHGTQTGISPSRTGLDSWLFWWGRFPFNWSHHSPGMQPRPVMGSVMVYHGIPRSSPSRSQVPRQGRSSEGALLFVCVHGVGEREKEVIRSPPTPKHTHTHTPPPSLPSSPPEMKGSLNKCVVQSLQ